MKNFWEYVEQIYTERAPVKVVEISGVNSVEIDLQDDKGGIKKTVTVDEFLNDKDPRVIELKNKMIAFAKDKYQLVGTDKEILTSTFGIFDTTPDIYMAGVNANITADGKIVKLSQKQSQQQNIKKEKEVQQRKEQIRGERFVDQVYDTKK